MELTHVYKRVIGLDVYQAQITACALIEQADGVLTVERREFDGFKRDHKTLVRIFHANE
jgi:transposase